MLFFYGTVIVKWVKGWNSYWCSQHTWGKIAVISKNLKNKVRSAIGNMNGEIVLLDKKVNDKIKAAEKGVKYGFMMPFKTLSMMRLLTTD